MSRLFIYYNGRLNDGVNDGALDDSGCSIASAILGLKELGCCNEGLFPYDIKRINERPPKHCYEDAKYYRITNGATLKVNLQEMKECLAEGYPFVFGLTIVPSFTEAETNGGLVPLPEPDDEIDGNHYQHAMLAVGYDDRSKHFIVKNSWGPNWVSSTRKLTTEAFIIMY